VAGRATEKTRARPVRKRRPRIGRRRLRLVWLLALVGVALYLYYRPLASYLETRNELAMSRAEVETLRIVKAELELRLVSLTSLEATQRDARRIGYVRPGEQLFVVKGIPAWRRAQRTLRDDG
jgi:cell division protein FtsB